MIQVSSLVLLEGVPRVLRNEPLPFTGGAQFLAQGTKVVKDLPHFAWNLAPGV